MTDERVMIKLGLTTGAGSSHGKSVRSKRQFGSLLFTPFMTL